MSDDFSNDQDFAKLSEGALDNVEYGNKILLQASKVNEIANIFNEAHPVFKGH